MEWRIRVTRSAIFVLRAAHLKADQFEAAGARAVDVHLAGGKQSAAAVVASGVVGIGVVADDVRCRLFFAGHTGRLAIQENSDRYQTVQPVDSAISNAVRASNGRPGDCRR